MLKRPGKQDVGGRPAEGRVDVLPGGDFTIPIDRNGLAIYYSIRGRHLLYNGHTGFFSDALPPVAAEGFAALAATGRERERRLSALADTYGDAGRDLLSEIALLQAGTHPDLAPEPRQPGFAHQMNPHIFTVYVSQGCNLSCQYCFNQGGSFGRRSSLMSPDTAREVLAFISRIVCSETHPVVTVNLFGGEPLLSPEAALILARGLQDLNHRGLKTCVHILLFTNGTLYRKEVFDVLAERPDLCTVLVSLDGTKEAHDRNRPFANAGQGSSYDAVVTNLRRMTQDGIPYSVACVVPYPFDFIGNAEALHAIGVPSLEIKDPHYHIYGRPELPEVLRNEVHTWRENYLAYTDYYMDYLDGGGAVRHVDRLATLRDTAGVLIGGRAQGITLACRLADLKVGITPEGVIMPCIAFLRHERYGLGDVRNGFDPEQYARFRDWLLAEGQHRTDHERCRSCYAKLLCGGGCYSESLDKTGSLQPHGEPACTYRRERAKIDLYFLSAMRKRHPQVFATATGIPA